MIQNLNQLTFQDYGTVVSERAQAAQQVSTSSAPMLQLVPGEDGSSFTVTAIGQGKTELVFACSTLRVTLPVEIKADGTVLTGDAVVEKAVTE